ncbi:DUF2961 domain-containing protein [Brachybacterium sacelli]|uniref:DUF2961 domain-containing protein n=1 Tax=Brachybacterium sacelli TaxID=173364 RepID=A0ABS4WWH7_9MICO|nr:DUF2961 domain-containing protein [Brachybacterium sacelli]MBP2380508.1 hypothetical protein [Brachybacterium sacelli]
MLNLPRPRATRQVTTFDRESGLKVALIEPGASRTVARIDGSGYLAKLWLTLPGWFWAHWEPDRLVDPAVLKHVVLRIHVDDSEHPQIAAPIADLFGLGLARVRNYASRWVGASSGGFYLTLPMPFRHSLRIDIDNRDPDQRVDLFLNGLYQLADLPPDAPVLHGAFSTGRHQGEDPLTLLEATGPGRYVGTLLSLQGEPRSYLSYLEAPEHIDADGEQIIGTGMEDYFLGGWYFREGPVIGPDHGVILKDNLDSAVSLYRFHDTDAIWFDSALTFRFSNPWDPARLRPFAHSAVAFSYLDVARSVPPVPDRAELRCWYRWHTEDHPSIP